MLLAVPYYFAAAYFHQLLTEGGPGWLNLAVLWCGALTLSFVFMGPVSLLLLLATRIHERTSSRRALAATR